MDDKKVNLSVDEFANVVAKAMKDPEKENKTRFYFGLEGDVQEYIYVIQVWL